MQALETQLRITPRADLLPPSKDHLNTCICTMGNPCYLLLPVGSVLHETWRKTEHPTQAANKRTAV